MEFGGINSYVQLKMTPRRMSPFQSPLPLFCPLEKKEQYTNSTGWYSLHSTLQTHQFNSSHQNNLTSETKSLKPLHINIIFLKILSTLVQKITVVYDIFWLLLNELWVVTLKVWTLNVRLLSRITHHLTPALPALD